MHFNRVQTEALRQSEYGSDFALLEKSYLANFDSSRQVYSQLLTSIDQEKVESTEKLTSTLKSLKDEQQEIREEVKALLVTQNPKTETRDTD